MTDAEKHILRRLDELADAIEGMQWSRTLAEREWLTVADVARLTGWEEGTVQDKAKRGVIPMFKIGRDWRITPADFDKWEAKVSHEGMAMGARYPLRRRR